MTAELPIPPALVLILGALLLPALRGAARPAALLLLPLLTLWLVWTLPDGMVLRLGFLGYELTPLKIDKLSRLFAIVFALMSLAGSLFALRQPRTLELSAAFAYAGSAIGAVMAGDLVSLFVFWELMAVGSTLVILAAGSGARAAALRYAVMHLVGGVLLMAGIAGEIQATGSVALGSMDTSTPARWLILAGFLVNAGTPPVSAWISDAYPESSWSGMVFLSAFTTKTAVYALIRGFPGSEILITIGLFMVLYGIIYAILENDMRRILAYSIVNQVGFMVTGVGIGTEMALNGAAAHAFTSVLYTALLLMSAGAVLFATATTNRSITAFRRAVANGTLSYAVGIEDGQVGVGASLLAPSAVAVDGDQVVVADALGDAVNRRRFVDGASPTFELDEVIALDTDGANGTQQPVALAYAADQARLYVASAASSQPAGAASVAPSNRRRVVMSSSRAPG